MNYSDFVYAKCSHPEHNNQQLSRLCVEETCIKKGLICCLCEYQSHYGHKTIALKQLLQQFQNQAHLQTVLNHAQKAKCLQNIKINFLKQLAIVRSQVQDQFLAIQNKVKMYFNSSQDKTIDLFWLSQMRKKREKPSDREFKTFIDKIVSFFESQDQNGFKIGRKVQNIIENSQKSIKIASQTLNLIANQVTKQTQKITQILQKKSGSFLKRMDWSDTLKGQFISIQSKLITQLKTQQNNQTFVMTEKPLPTNCRSTWAIRVKNIVGWIGVGVGLRKTLKQNNFCFKAINIGHGSYMISTNGLSWSHTYKQFNSTVKSFKFAPNDVIYMEYDPINNRIRFRKNNSKSVKDNFELTTIFPPVGNRYHPCVHLGSNGDSAQLIFPGFSLS